MRGLAFVKRLMLGLCGLVVLTAAAGFIFQKSQEAGDRERYPPPGKLFDVQGTKMHIHCTGEGSPTVVFEMGLSETSSYWTDIHDKIAATTRVCSYDRVGLGYSEPVGRPIPSQEVASRLRTLLREAGVDDKLILVGYSAGGIHIRQFYQQDPERVVGMVLVESTHEQQGTRLPAWPTPPFMAKVYPYLSYVGYFRFFGATKPDYAWLKLGDVALGRTMTAEHFGSPWIGRNGGSTSVLGGC